MSSRRHLSYDPVTKTQDIVHLDGTGKGVVESIQDCEDVLELNKLEGEYFDKKQDYWKIGSIPLTMCFAWAKECGARPFTRDWQAYAKKQMNLPEYSKLNVNRIKV